MQTSFCSIQVEGSRYNSKGKQEICRSALIKVQIPTEDLKRLIIIGAATFLDEEIFVAI